MWSRTSTCFVGILSPRDWIACDDAKYSYPCHTWLIFNKVMHDDKIPGKILSMQIPPFFVKSHIFCCYSGLVFLALIGIACDDAKYSYPCHTWCI